MSKLTLLVFLVALFGLAPAYGQNDKDLCTDAQIKQMDQHLPIMTDAAKKKEVTTHLEEAKAAMNKGDTAECVEHMKAAHKIMGHD